MTSWTRRPLAALAVCALLLAGAAGCGAGGARGSGEGRPTGPVGRITGRTDEEGRAYREVDKKDAPEIGVEVRPDAAGNWDVRLTLRRFRFSPADAAAHPAAGRGLARLLVDGRPVGRLRTPEYRLSGRLVPRGTHHVTARLYADDDTVWAVSGKPVQSTADITASDPHATDDATPTAPGTPGPPTAPVTATPGAQAATASRTRAGARESGELPASVVSVAAAVGSGVPGVGVRTAPEGDARSGGPGGTEAAAIDGAVEVPAGATAPHDGGAAVTAPGGAPPVRGEMTTAGLLALLASRASLGSARGNAGDVSGAGRALRAPEGTGAGAYASGRASPGCRRQAS
ncbi:hypothetical protein [Streptomyces sp. NPDC056160]|uniref:hypothetical protein n=1 Tax=Streptomyces sp. NPDC056160 TaxID=3345731 RepID=UPI0035DD11A3